MFPNFISITRSRDFCLCNLTEVWIIQSGFVYYLKSLPSQLVKQQIRIVFMGALQRFPGQPFFLTGLDLFSSWKEWQDMGRDITEAGVRKEGVGREAGRARLWTPVQACWPNQAAISSSKSCSQPDWHSFLRKTIQTISGNHICKSTDFWIKPQQLNRLQRNERETANNAGPPGASYGYRCYKNTARVMGKHCKCALKILMFPSERGSLERRCEHISLPC